MKQRFKLPAKRSPPLRNDVRPLIFGASSAIGASLLPQFASYTAVSRFTQRDPRWWLSGLEVAPAAPAATTHILSLGPLDAFAAWLSRHPLPSSVRQIIAMSSTSAQTKIASSASGEAQIAQRLVDSETRVRHRSAEFGIASTLLRASMLYGGEQHLVARIQRMVRRFYTYPFLIGPGASALRQPVHVADIASAVLLCIDQPQAFDRQLVVAGAERLSLRELIIRSARATQRLAIPIPTPTHLIGRISLERLAQDQVFDVGTARDLGFTPRCFLP